MTEQVASEGGGLEIPSEYITDGKILGQYDNVPALLDALGAAQPGGGNPPRRRSRSTSRLLRSPHPKAV